MLTLELDWIGLKEHAVVPPVHELVNPSPRDARVPVPPIYDVLAVVKAAMEEHKNVDGKQR